MSEFGIMPSIPIIFFSLITTKTTDNLTDNKDKYRIIIKKRCEMRVGC